MKTQEIQKGDVVRIEGVVTYMTSSYVHVLPPGAVESVLVPPQCITFVRPKIEVGMQVDYRLMTLTVAAIVDDEAWLKTKIGEAIFAKLADLSRPSEPELPMEQPVGAAPSSASPPDASLAGAPQTDEVASQYEAGDRPDPFAVR